MFLLFSFLSFSRYFSCFYLFIFCCLVHTVNHTMLGILSLQLQKHMGLNYQFFNLQYSFSISFFPPSILLFFLPFFLSFFLSFFLPSFLPSFFSFPLSLLKKSLKWRNEPRLKKRGSIGKSRLDYKIETRLRNRAWNVAEWQNEVSWSF